MAKFYDMKVTFTGGEVAPEMYARGDLVPHANGAKELLNVIPLPQGGWINRPGTTVISNGSALDGAKLVEFVYNKDQSFVMIWKTDGDIDIYKNSVFTYALRGHPFSAAQLPDIRWLQSNDIMYVYHKEIPVQKISRYSDTEWTIEEAGFLNGPYQDLNTNKEITLEINGDRMYSSVDFFTATMVGEQVRIEFKQRADSGDYQLTYESGDTAPAPTESEEFMIFGAGVIESRGNWTGTARIYRKFPDSDDFDLVSTYRSENNYNFRFTTDVEEYGTIFKVTYERESGRGDLGFTWSSGGGVVARQVKIIRFIDARTVEIESLDDVTSNTGMTSDWAFGAFSPRYGYPALAIFHQERHVIGNTRAYPQTTWMSRSASWEDFEISIPALDTDAITRTLASKQLNEILGFASRGDLLIFTSGGEWVAQAGSKSDVFTPSSMTITPLGYIGCANLQPVDVGPETLFVNRHSKKVYAIGYSGGGSSDNYGYAVRDLTAMAPHFFKSRTIIRYEYQQTPWSLVWVLLDNGDMLSLTLNQEHQIMAWARHEFPHAVKDICCIPGKNQDDLYMIAGTGASTVFLRMQERKDGEDWNPTIFMDEGRIPVESACELLEYEQLQANGSLQGRNKHIARVTFRVMNTCGFRAGIINENNSDLDPVRFPDQLSPAYRANPYTGDIYMEIPGGAGKECRLRITNSEAAPITMLGIFMEVHVDESP